MKSRIHFTQVPISQTENAPRFLKHPFFGWAGLRPILAQHTAAEHEALMRYSRNALSVVEIGVAEGASASGLREAMPPQGTLYLVDPFHLSRFPVLNFLKRAARRAVNSAGEARAIWIEALSQEAVLNWNRPIDFLLIDGDHREEAVERDWLEWSPFIAVNGVVAFHDARLFPSGWTSPEYGPVRLVERLFRDGSARLWTIVEEVDSLVFVSRMRPM